MKSTKGLEGPIFGALILGVGIGYLVYKKTENPMMAIGAAVGVFLIDLAFLLLVRRFTGRG